jgi:hypothetical protein
MKRYPVTHEGKEIGTLEIPQGKRMTPAEYAFAKSLLMMCEKVGKKNVRRKPRVHKHK